MRVFSFLAAAISGVGALTVSQKAENMNADLALIQAEQATTAQGPGHRRAIQRSVNVLGRIAAQEFSNIKGVRKLLHAERLEYHRLRRLKRINVGLAHRRRKLAHHHRNRYRHQWWRQRNFYKNRMWHIRKAQGVVNHKRRQIRGWYHQYRLARRRAHHYRHMIHRAERNIRASRRFLKLAHKRRQLIHTMAVDVRRNHHRIRHLCHNIQRFMPYARYQRLGSFRITSAVKGDFWRLCHMKVRSIGRIYTSADFGRHLHQYRHMLKKYRHERALAYREERRMARERAHRNRHK